MIFINPIFNTSICNSTAGNYVISVTCEIDHTSYLLSLVYSAPMATDLNNQSILHHLKEVKKLIQNTDGCFWAN